MRRYLFLFFFLTACATEKSEGLSEHGSHRQRMERQFGLSDAQALALRDLRKKHRGSLVGLSEKEKAAKDDLDRAMLDPLTSRADFEGFFLRYKEAQLAKDQAALDFLWDVRSVLTDEQRSKWRQWYLERKTVGDESLR